MTYYGTGYTFPERCVVPGWYKSKHEGHNEHDTTPGYRLPAFYMFVLHLSESGPLHILSMRVCHVLYIHVIRFKRNTYGNNITRVSIIRGLLFWDLCVFVIVKLKERYPDVISSPVLGYTYVSKHSTPCRRGEPCIYGCNTCINLRLPSSFYRGTR
jgi:predicted membrane protein